MVFPAASGGEVKTSTNEPGIPMIVWILAVLAAIVGGIISSKVHLSPQAQDTLQTIFDAVDGD